MSGTTQALTGRSRTTWALALALAFMLGTAQKCDQATEGKQEPGAALTDGVWTLTTLDGKAIQLPEGTRAPDLTIDKGHAVTGFGGCNRFGGQAKVDGTAIAFPGLMRTKMYCAAVQATEDAFMTALGATNTYRISGKTLFLLDKDKELATLVLP